MAPRRLTFTRSTRDSWGVCHLVRLHTITRTVTLRGGGELTAPHPLALTPAHSSCTVNRKRFESAQAGSVSEASFPRVDTWDRPRFTKRRKGQSHRTRERSGSFASLLFNPIQRRPFEAGMFYSPPHLFFYYRHQKKFTFL